MAKHNCVSDTLMNRLYEGDLPESERSRVEKHIERCSTCGKRWDVFLQGEQFLRQAFTPTELDTGKCPDEEALAAYVDEALPSAETSRIREHLLSCSACNQLVMSARYATDQWYESAAQPDREVAAAGILDILLRLPDVAERVRGWLREKQRLAVSFIEDIALPCFEPGPLAAQRLAAETGEGFRRQRLRQPESQFDVELVQFGREARVIVTTKPEVEGFNDCLAEVRFLEGDQPKLIRSILVKNGKGQCALASEETEQARPDAEPFKLEVRPVVTLKQLEELEPEASVAILADLLEHSDPLVRRLSVELLGEVGGSHALEAVDRAKEDPDPDVRSAAALAEERLRRRGLTETRGDERS